MNIKKLWHKIKAIPFIGETYEKYIGSKKVAYIENKCRKELSQDGEKYIEIVENTLNGSGLLYYAYAGTLLGLIRDGKLIEWDSDIDYAVVINDDSTWVKLEELMNKKGFKKTREFVFEDFVREQSYAIKKMNIDFFGQFYDGDNMLEYAFKYLSDVKYNNENERSVLVTTFPKVTETKKLQFGNTFVSVPVNSEDVLVVAYNEDWRTPNPNWQLGDSNKCTKLSKDKIGYQVVI